MANTAAAAPCLAQTVGSDVRKGVIDYEKLEDAKRNFCLNLAKPFKITIRNSSAEIFSVGNLQEIGVKISQPLPVLIKNGEDYSNGVLDVEVSS